MNNSLPSNPSQEEITNRAHTIWVQNGRPDGRDLEHWLQAENELRKEGQRVGTETHAQGAELASASGRGAQRPASAGTKKRS